VTKTAQTGKKHLHPVAFRSVQIQYVADHCNIGALPQRAAEDNFPYKINRVVNDNWLTGMGHINLLRFLIRGPK
jgi:hypothetical protein